MSGNSSHGSGSTFNVQNNDPWAPQQGYLLNAFNDAQTAYNNGTAAGPYSGNYVAPTNANQYAAANNGYNWATGLGSHIVNDITGTGTDNNTSGWAGANGALNGLSNFAGTNQTQNNINAAGQYANNPYIGGMVNAAMQSAQQNASENTIPNIYRQAAGSGNINSDRAALAQGVVQRGLGEQAGNIAANLEGNAYNTGISAALQGNAQQLQALSQQGSLGSNIGQSGLNALSTGINDQGALNNMAQNGANAVQQLDQSNLNNQIQKYQGQQNFPWQQLQNYYNVIGNRSWGSQGTSYDQKQQQKQEQPSMMSTIGSGIGILGSLF